MLFNKYYGYHGHVWYDRFKSKIIESLQQFIAVYNYIVNNPVKAGLVETAEEYKYSGLNYLRMKDYTVIDPPEETIIINYLTTFLK